MVLSLHVNIVIRFLLSFDKGPMVRNTLRFLIKEANDCLSHLPKACSNIFYTGIPECKTMYASENHSLCQKASFNVVFDDLVTRAKGT